MSLDRPLFSLWNILEGLILEDDKPLLSTWDALDQARSLSSREFVQKVLALAQGLKKIIQPGERIGLLGKPSPEWMVCDFSILGAGAVTVPLFPGTAPDILAFQIKKAKISKIFVLEEEWLPSEEMSQGLRYMVPHAVLGRTDKISLIADLAWELSPELQAHELWQALNQDLHPSQVATIIFTSGSTGQPKGVPLTHANLVSQILGSSKRFPLEPVTDVALSFLPLAHVFERMVTYFYLWKKIPIYFCESVPKLGARLREVQPTVMTCVPRLLEKVQSAMSTEASKKPSPQKEIARWALSMALTHPEHLPQPMLSWFAADHLVYSKLRASLGGKLNMLIVGGAALSPRLARFFNNIGIPTYQGYGMTETSPVIAANCPGQNKGGTVGCAFPHVEIKIDPQTQEICVKGPGVMAGYLDEVENIIDAEGFLHTGDLGELSESGFLTITGRKKEMMKTSNGKYVCPVPIEAAICAHAWIDQAMLIAEGKNFVTALLVADETTCSQELLALVHQGEVPENSALLKPIWEHFDRVNASLNPWEQVQKLAWIPQPLSVEMGELTPTLKIRRHIVEKKYSYLIERMYNTSS